MNKSKYLPALHALLAPNSHFYQRQLIRVQYGRSQPTRHELPIPPHRLQKENVEENF